MYSGNNSIIGEYSVIHACNLGKNVIIGNNCVVMDGAKIGDHVIIQNNSLVPPGKKFSSYSIVAGSPAKVVKQIVEYMENYNDFLVALEKQVKKLKKDFFSGKALYEEIGHD